ncbi:hypothetical protein ACN28S_39745 [Cystobacter fuscus]
MPIIGTLAGMASVPLASLTLTHALGRLFIQHFETGGTLLNFDAEAMRKHFLDEFEASKAHAANMQQGTAQQST